MENQCEVLNRSSCWGSVNYIIFSRRRSAQTCQVPACGGCLSSCWGKSLSPGSSVNCKRTSYPRKAACSGQLSEANPQHHHAFRYHRDKRCQELQSEAARVSASRLVSMHSVNLKKKQDHPVWVAWRYGGLSGGARRDQRPWKASKEKQRGKQGFVKGWLVPLWTSEQSHWVPTIWPAWWEAVFWLLLWKPPIVPCNRLFSSPLACRPHHQPSHPSFEITV